MRTTVSIQDTLLEKAKAAALARSCTLGEVIEDALREVLAAKPKPARKKIRPLLTYLGTGVRPGVDLSSSESLLETMEGR